MKRSMILFASLISVGSTAMGAPKVTTPKITSVSIQSNVDANTSALTIHGLNFNGSEKIFVDLTPNDALAFETELINPTISGDIISASRAPRLNAGSYRLLVISQNSGKSDTFDFAVAKVQQTTFADISGRTLGDGQNHFASASCSAGEAVSGGYVATGRTIIINSYKDSASSWRVDFASFVATDDISLTVQVTCEFP